MYNITTPDPIEGIVYTKEILLKDIKTLEEFISLARSGNWTINEKKIADILTIKDLLVLFRPICSVPLNTFNDFINAWGPSSVELADNIIIPDNIKHLVHPLNREKQLDRSNGTLQLCNTFIVSESGEILSD